MLRQTVFRRLTYRSLLFIHQRHAREGGHYFPLEKCSQANDDVFASVDSLERACSTVAN